jgi:hypothetical protein
MREVGNAYKISVRKLLGNYPFGRPKLGWEDIKVYLKNKVAGFGLNTFVWGYKPLVGCLNKGNEPPCSIKRGEYVE